MIVSSCEAESDNGCSILGKSRIFDPFRGPDMIMGRKDRERHRFGVSTQYRLPLIQLPNEILVYILENSQGTLYQAKKAPPKEIRLQKGSLQRSAIQGIFQVICLKLWRSLIILIFTFAPARKNPKRRFLLKIDQPSLIFPQFCFQRYYYFDCILLRGRKR